jgi:hypothetical protein
VSEPVRLVVRAGDCPCPGAPHDSEWVDLMATPTLPLAGAIIVGIQSAPGDVASREAAFVEACLPRAILAWSFMERDDGGHVVPAVIDNDNLERLLPWAHGGFELVNEIERLYASEVSLTLERMTSKLSAPSSTDGSTSPSLPSGTDTPTPSVPSSRNGGAGKRSAAPDR